jgi:hypothetical protein
MDDLEAQLRDMLALRATTATAAPTMTSELRNRIGRRRQVRGGAAIGIVAVLVVGSALAARTPGTADSTLTAGATVGATNATSATSTTTVPLAPVSCATGNAPTYLVEYIRREVQGFTPVDWTGIDPPAIATFSPNTPDATAYNVRIEGVPFTDNRGDVGPGAPVFAELHLTGDATPATPSGYGGSWTTTGPDLVDPGTFSLALACLPPGPKADPAPAVPCNAILTGTTSAGGNRMGCDGSGAPVTSYVTITRVP